MYQLEGEPPLAPFFITPQRRRCDSVHGPEGVAGVVRYYVKIPEGSTPRNSERIGGRSRGVVRNPG